MRQYTEPARETAERKPSKRQNGKGERETIKGERRNGERERERERETKRKRQTYVRFRRICMYSIYSANDKRNHCYFAHEVDAKGGARTKRNETRTNETKRNKGKDKGTTWEAGGSWRVSNESTPSTPTQIHATQRPHYDYDTQHQTPSTKQRTTKRRGRQNRRNELAGRRNKRYEGNQNG